MSTSISNIDLSRVPKHIAIIMDGNGRWAQEKGQDRIFGHYEGVLSVKSAVEACGEVGVQYLTLYAFSTENWNRPKAEVDALMELLVNTLNSEFESLHKNNVRLHVIGDFYSLPNICQQKLNDAIRLTSNNSGLNLILALSYSAKWELKEAFKSIVTDIEKGTITKEDISESLISEYLNTKHFPDPELMIRTSGECRISNFLLYQLAYAELYFTHVHWPDFRKEHLFEAIFNYQNRERRFGKTGDQIKQHEQQTV